MLKVMRRSTWRAVLQRHRAQLDEARRGPRVTDLERERVAKASKLVDDLWQMHSSPVCHDKPGHGLIGQTWWCPACRTVWPCATATRLSHWGQIGKAASAQYEPLRLRVVGEVREKNAIRFPDAGEWHRAEGVQPDEDEEA